MKDYVHQDPDGEIRVGDTKVTLGGIVFEYMQGMTAETIQEMYPRLSLEQVYGALTYFLANRDEVEQYMKRRRAEWERSRAEQDRNTDPLLQRMRQLTRDRAKAS